MLILSDSWDVVLRITNQRVVVDGQGNKMMKMRKGDFTEKRREEKSVIMISKKKGMMLRDQKDVLSRKWHYN